VLWTCSIFEDIKGDQVRLDAIEAWGWGLSKKQGSFRVSVWRKKQIVQPGPRSGRLLYLTSSNAQLHATGRRCVGVAMIASWLRSLGKAPEDSDSGCCATRAARGTADVMPLWLSPVAGVQF
jgi:hypothetical protein